jgi:hypothetical protein
VNKRERLARADKRDSQLVWVLLGGILLFLPIGTLTTRPPGADRTAILAVESGFCLLWFVLGWRRARILPVLLLFLGSFMLWQGVAKVLFPYPGLPKQTLVAVLYGCVGLGAYYFAWRQRAGTAIRHYTRVRFVTNRYHDAGVANGAIGYVVQTNPDQSYEIEVADEYGNVVVRLVVQRQDVIFDPPK